MKTPSRLLTLCLAAFTLPWTGNILNAQAPAVPAEYQQVLTTLGKQGDFKDGVLKLNIPRNDLKVTVDGIATPTPFGFGGWLALTKGDGGMDVMMGDLVLLEDEVNPVMSALLDNGLEVTALHNHFFFESPRMFYMHVHGHGKATDLARMAKPAPGTPPEKIPQIKDAGVVELLKQQKTTKFPPGTKWDYSNSGYAVLAMVVEKVSGQPFGDFLHARIFAPLDMKQTVAYEKGRNTVSHRAYGHTREAGVWRELDQSPTSAVLGDGGVYSSLDDLAKWERALTHHTLLSEAEMQPAVTPVKVADGSVQEPDGQPAAYGFGWFLNPYRDHPRMWHYGETVGFRSTIQHFVEDKITVIVLSNRDDVVPANLALKVADLFLTARR